MKEISEKQVKDVLNQQHLFYETNATKDARFRIHQLMRLKEGIKANEKEILAALREDLGKHEVESYMTEVGLVYKSIQETVSHLKKWMKPQRVKTPYYMLPAKSYTVAEPYGSVLIIGPFNYPFQLVIEPLIGALGAGNCAVIKMSELTPKVSEVMKRMLNEIFPAKYVWCVEGSIPTTTILLEQKFDYIFFTGSPMVGKIVMQAAAKHMTPVTLELGGKSPVIVDESANLKIAAKRILWGKMVNAGQTCVAPDYVYVHENVKEKLILEIKRSYHQYYGKNPQQSECYGKIVNDRHYLRLCNILEREKEHIIFGGEKDLENRFLGFTMIDVKSREQECMQEELFGPILPILTYHNLTEVISEINHNPKPLALYIFSEKKNVQKMVLKQTTSGGACINDVISHVANLNLPFGGVGNSGMGSYHGKDSFYTFSHRKSIFDNRGSLSSRLAQPPYNKIQYAILRKVFR